jgi:diaminopimelate epimerase
VKLEFTKMHGAGNDFVVIDAVTRKVVLKPAQIRRLADRHRGIGCDQVLLVEPPDQPEADFRYRIFNADGSEAGQCGNGARCFARFVREKRLSFKQILNVQTRDGIMQLETLEDGRVLANLGSPRIEPTQVPFTADSCQLDYDIEVDGQRHTIGVLSMGNPHAVLWVDDVEQAPVISLGPRIETHTRFPEGANVGFAQWVSRTEIKLRVWERGAGETQACGTAACAAVVHGIRSQRLDATVTALLPGGKLTVTWAGSDESPVWLGGPTASVFDGVIKLRNG